MPNYYQEIRDIRRQEIMDITFQMVADLGIFNVQMKDIAEKAAISRQTLYKYFDSFDALILAVQKHTLTSIRSQVASKELDKSDPLTYIKETIELLFNLKDKHWQEWGFIINYDYYYNITCPNADMFEKYNNFLSQFKLSTSAYEQLTIAQQQGRLNKDVDIEGYLVYQNNTILSIIQREIILQNNPKALSRQHILAVREHFIKTSIAYLEKGR